jgi:hypothetical protein
MSNHHTLQIKVIVMKKFNLALAQAAILFFGFFLEIPSEASAQNTVSYTSDEIIKHVFIGDDSRLTETAYNLRNTDQNGELDLVLLKSLVFDNVPTIFFKEQKVINENKSYPQRLITDINSLGLLRSVGNEIRTIKILQIELTQIREKSSLRLKTEDLSNLSNLNYLLIKTTFPITKEEVSQMFSGFVDGDIILLYQVNSSF